jgi:cation diffusion facilitator CzcD-associated flavoprotein CzcO
MGPVQVYLLAVSFHQVLRILPHAARNLVRKGIKPQLPPDMELDPNFNPSYFPWEQRMCLCPDGDFFQALRSGKGSVVTGVVDSINKGSIKLTSGGELSPDVIVTATGLKMQFAGGTKLTVNGKQFIVNEKYVWKNVMIQDLRNVAVVVGYVDASWT